MTILPVSKSLTFAFAILGLRGQKLPEPSRHFSALMRSGLMLLLIGALQMAWANTNKIKKENLKPGTTDWQLTNPADNRQIEGYASLTSVPNHGVISLFVNTNDASYTLNVYRMGWYGGAGGRLVMGPVTLNGVQQVIPTTDPTEGIIECQWVQPYKIKVPYSWLSGIYLVKLHGNTSGKESYITFTVRDSRRAKIVFQQSVATYQAYNPWPGIDPATGVTLGQSLYPWETANGAQVKAVSFDRPYTQYTGIAFPYPFFYGVGAGDFLYNLAPVAMEFSMVRWLEHEGYDVTYITDIDTHEDVGQLLRGKAFLSVGHDEYWSQEMKANVVEANSLGVSLGFFGGNYMYWPVEFYPDSNGSPDRTISLLSQANKCSVTQAQCGSDADCSAGESCQVKVCDYSCYLDENGVHSETEQAIVGAMDEPGSVLSSVVWGGDMVINGDTQLNHWVFANTGLNLNDVIPGLIGIEYNSTLLEYPLPPNLYILTHEQAPNFAGAAGDPTMNIGGYDIPDDFNGEDFNVWYNEWAFFQAAGGQLDHTCDTRPIPPLNIPLPPGYCRNPFPYWPTEREDWSMTIYQADSGAWVFNAATNEWTWGLDDYYTGIDNGDGVNNGPAFRPQCGYPFLHPGLVSCKNAAVEQITRNVLNRFITGH